MMSPVVVDSYAPFEACRVVALALKSLPSLAGVEELWDCHSTTRPILMRVNDTWKAECILTIETFGMFIKAKVSMIVSDKEASGSAEIAFPEDMRREPMNFRFWRRGDILTISR